MSNSNAQAIFFTAQAREYARHVALTYTKASAMVNEYNAQGISAVIPNDSTQMADGAAVNGQPIARNQDVIAAVTRAMELIADLEANSKAKLNTILALCNTPI
jgi:hypothetical protein